MIFTDEVREEGWYWVKPKDRYGFDGWVVARYERPVTIGGPWILIVHQEECDYYETAIERVGPRLEPPAD